MKRLFGDSSGSVLMEYVVLGVMVVAAVVAIVLLFGAQMRAGFDKMTKALKGEPESAADVVDVEDDKIDAARTKGREVATEKSEFHGDTE